MYRLFRLDVAGKFRDWSAIEARSDEDALRIAQAMDRAFDCELWRGDKFLGRINKRPSAPNGSSPTPTKDA